MNEAETRAEYIDQRCTGITCPKKCPTQLIELSHDEVSRKLKNEARKAKGTPKDDLLTI